MAKKKTESNFLQEPLWIPLAQVKPDPDNANDHTPRSIEAIARSLLRFGMRKNVVADKRGVIRAGNGTYEAVQWIADQITDSPEDEEIRAQACKWGILREVQKGNVVKLVPYIRCEITDLEADEATAYALADNQTGRLSELDFTRVASQLRDMQARKVRIDDLGFDTSFFADLNKSSDKIPPQDFPEFGEDIEVAYRCPSCHYEWSGKAK